MESSPMKFSGKTYTAQHAMSKRHHGVEFMTEVRILQKTRHVGDAHIVEAKEGGRA